MTFDLVVMRESERERERERNWNVLWAGPTSVLGWWHPPAQDLLSGSCRQLWWLSSHVAALGNLGILGIVRERPK